MNANFVVYDATGRILRTGSCPPEYVEIQAQAGESVIEGDAGLDTHYVVAGVITPYSAEELAAKSAMPPGHVWDMPDRVVVDVRSLEQAKTLKLEAILRRCDAALQPIKEGYPLSEQQTWDRQEREARNAAADSGAVTPLLSALAGARGITVPDLVSRIIAKADAFAAYSGAVIGARQRCEDAIAAANTIAAVDAVE